MRWFHRLINKHLRKRERNLSPEELDTILSHTIDLDQVWFDDAISAVHALTLDAKNKMEAAAVYDLVIWAIGRSVAADGCSALMLGRRVPDNWDISYDKSFPIMKEAKAGQRMIDLSKCNAYTGCWHYDRIASTVASVLKNGYFQYSNSNGVYYPEIRFAIMMNGRHHTTWAVYLGECNVNLDVISLTPYFDIVSTDGAFYHFENSYHEPQHIRVQDYRMAVLFQLAKERSKLDVPDTAGTYAQRTQTSNPAGLSSK